MGGLKGALLLAVRKLLQLALLLDKGLGQVGAAGDCNFVRLADRNPGNQAASVLLDDYAWLRGGCILWLLRSVLGMEPAGQGEGESQERCELCKFFHKSLNLK